MNYWYWSHCHPYFTYRDFRRRFMTEEEREEMKTHLKEKKIKWLTHYKENLEKELAGVNERLDELSKEED